VNRERLTVTIPPPLPTGPPSVRTLGWFLHYGFPTGFVGPSLTMLPSLTAVRAKDTRLQPKQILFKDVPITITTFCKGLRAYQRKVFYYSSYQKTERLFLMGSSHSRSKLKRCGIMAKKPKFSSQRPIIGPRVFLS
jgi:hypothetical protein